MGVVFSNNCATTLSSAISTSDTTIAVADASAFPTLSGSDYTYATLEDASNNVEVVKVTAISSNNLTVTRAQDSTTARAFSSGDRCQLRLNAALLNDATFSRSFNDLTDVPSTTFTNANATKLAGIETGATADQTASEIKALYETETNAFTDSQFSKLSGIETGATADQTGSQIKTLYEAQNSAFTDSQFTKLAGIETAATADQTGSEIKALYEAESSAFTDAQFTKLAGIETGATGDQTAAEIKSLYEGTANAWTYAQFTKLAGIETGATVCDAQSVTAAGAVMDSELTSETGIKTLTVPNGTTITSTAATLLDDSSYTAMRTTLALTPANIKTYYEQNTDTNPFTNANFTKLSGIETGATADQTSSEIASAYNSEVAQVSSSERTAGNSTAIKRFSPADVTSMVTTHSPPYSLPTATSSALGGVKVGDTLSITSGVLNVKGLIYSDIISPAANATIFTDNGYTLKWDSFYNQFTIEHSSFAYLAQCTVKIDGGQSAATQRANSYYLTTSGGGANLFTFQGNYDSNYNLSTVGSKFSTIFHEYYTPHVAYKVEALRTHTSLVIQVWRI